MQKKMSESKILGLIIVIIIISAIGLPIVFFLRNFFPPIPWHGIPIATYRLINENGDFELSNDSNYISVKADYATLAYLPYEIIKEDGIVYFIERSDDVYRRFQADYEKETKIITLTFIEGDPCSAAHKYPDCTCFRTRQFKKGGFVE